MVERLFLDDETLEELEDNGQAVAETREGTSLEITLNSVRFEVEEK